MTILAAISADALAGLMLLALVLIVVLAVVRIRAAR